MVSALVYRQNGRKSYMFPCNGNGQDPFVHGVPGIIAAYQQTISSIKLSGPTKFAPVIQETAKMARDSGR